MADGNNLFNLIQQIRDSAQNLSKDLDRKDPREETEADLEQLTLSFQDLKDILFSLKQEDKDNLAREMRELLSGQEDFQTYTRDVNKILMDVKNRIKADKNAEYKVAQNLPEQHQNETPSTLMDSFSKVIEQISNWTTKAGSR